MTGAHWAERKRAVDDAHAQVKAALTNCQRPAQPIRHCALLLTFYTPDQRRRDLDNLVGAAKPYTDALVAEKVLRDDSAKVVQQLLAQAEHRPSRPGFTIRIYASE